VSLLDPAAQRLWGALAATGRTRLRHHEVWQAWIGGDRGRADALDEYDRVAGLLAHLEAACRLRCSRTRTARNLPTQVSLLGVAPRPQRPAVVGWRAELHWVPAARPKGRRLQLLLRLNAWLRDRPEALDVVPAAERSLEIFAAPDEPEAEKILEHELWRYLFRPDRLDPAALGVQQVSLPFPRERLRGGDTLLIAENKSTFHSLLRCARERAGDPPVDAIGFGEGDRFLRTITSADDGVRRLHYFGDLDGNGLAIPVAAQDRARGVRALEVVPAVPLYRALLARGRPSPARSGPVPPHEAGRLAAWLPAEVREPVSRLLTSGQRLAQEWVGRSLLCELDRWIDG
jgi:hypothetical protein